MKPSLLILALLITGFCHAQTLTPVFIDSKTVDVEKVQFINSQTGKPLKTKINGQLIDILEDTPDTLTLIIPFLSGKVLEVYRIVSVYLLDCCVISVEQNGPMPPSCLRLWYIWNDMVEVESRGSNCENKLQSLSISSELLEYHKKTQNLGVAINYKATSSAYIEKVKAHFRAKKH